MNQSERKSNVDVFTVIAVSVIVYFLCSLLHEAVGHGGAAVLQGVTVSRITNAYCLIDNASETQRRIIASAGILVNMAVGFVVAFVSRKIDGDRNGVLRYFLWLLTIVNLFTAAGYMASFSLLRIGDLHRLVHGLPAEMVMRITILCFGIGMIIWTMWYAGRSLGRLIGNTGGQQKISLMLTVIPYAAGGLINVAASLLDSNVTVAKSLILISSVGAAFGGGFPMLFVHQCIPRSDDKTKTGGLQIRSRAWMIAGLVFLAFYLVLGRGIQFDVSSD